MADPSPFLPPAAPATDAPAVPSVLISVENSPKPKRGKWIAIAAVVVLLVGGFVAFLLTSGDDSGERFALQPAVENSQEVNSVASKIIMDIGFLGEITMDMRVDIEAELVAASMDMTSLDGPNIEMILDIEGGKAYIDNDSLGEESLDVPTRWIVTDLDDVEGLTDLGGGSEPAEMAKVLDDADNVEDLGMEKFEGEDVRHYRVTVNIADVIAADPSFEDQFGDLGTDMPEEIVYDVYVTANNELRRMVFELDVMGQSMTVEMVLTDYNSIEPIVIPDPSDVTEEDITGL